MFSHRLSWRQRVGDPKRNEVSGYRILNINLNITLALYHFGLILKKIWPYFAILIWQPSSHRLSWRQRVGDPKRNEVSGYRILNINLNITLALYHFGLILKKIWPYFVILIWQPSSHRLSWRQRVGDPKRNEVSGYRILNINLNITLALYHFGLILKKIWPYFAILIWQPSSHRLSWRQRFGDPKRNEVTEKQLKGDTLTQGIICEKARAIYGDLLNQTPRTSTDEASEDSFKASRGWFDNFTKRTGIHSVVRHGEAASSDVKAAGDYLKTFSELIEANGYIP
ncbi:hypothetical protein AVEN_121267-1 [Araneus ventricosus]|uniref:HTH CENPB-type domain-containing protein n=1 Tax=Araneus ventricosus TaxID=182803 RepID=A0A4Y2QD93_ARAVE|nr:hypothetical protein AVEN_121267-1 [Araneus ventricosus]